MDTLRKMHFFYPRIRVIGHQKCMTTIPGLLTIFKKISNLLNVVINFNDKNKKFLQVSIKGTSCPYYGHECVY